MLERLLFHPSEKSLPGFKFAQARDDLQLLPHLLQPL